jgi:HAD superfamily hydrolase (TIGR01509 family)
VTGTLARSLPDIDATLVRDIDLLCLDAGNTVVFLDHQRLALVCAREGFAVSAEALVRAEGEAKVAIERGEGVDVAWSNAHVRGAHGWGLVVATMLRRAGLALERVARALDGIWSTHRERNLWSLVPDGLPAALGRVRASGARVAIVSNSEGALEGILEDLGILGAFDLVIDSGIVGVEKPDPAIFRIAFDRFRIPPEHALHLGDTYGTDVLGARAAGARVALVDPYGHFAGLHTDVPRVPGAPQVANAIARARTMKGAE